MLGPNPRRRDQILAMYALGLSIVGIARTLGCRRQTVTSYLKSSGVHDSTAPRPRMAKCTVCGERTRLPPGVVKRRRHFRCQACRREALCGIATPWRGITEKSDLGVDGICG